ncbi:multidrug MFS transporter [Pandoraea aquatica]|uniref:Multidrug MFS transporter n=1 Tax=Pandoraea aquatica TaxID=2508290 RepID=A0A5E4T4G5_9BURK|nr:epoxide hydrolase [Pandoraea aquatica]VVD83056.1 multidrug MFS transporter [Pandoraea aquatica]
MHSAKLPRRASRAHPIRVLAVTTALASIGMFMPAWASAAQPSQAAPSASASTQAVDTSIRPFQFHASEQSLKDLRQRIAATKWPSRELVNDGTQGVQLETMKKLAQYWANDYDWRRVESKLNALPQFVTNIDGVDIHFIHVRSKNKNALPIIVTHGWPGSVVEQLKLIDPLTNPTAHGGSADDAFDIVIPSLPGYGFSGKPNELGWDPAHIARAWEELMRRLGYQHYVAQGGDWGDAVTEQMAVQAPPGLLAIHTNMPGAVPDEIQRSLDAHKPAPANLSADEKRAYEQLDFFYSHGLAYAQEMTARPQTLYGIEDSPVGLAAWMLDHDARSYELIARVFDGKQEGLTRDDVLDNITLYWLTNTAVSSARLYWENKLAFFAPKGIKIPVAVSAFPDELYQAPESWAKKAFPNLIYYSRPAKGGHFAAWEQPDTLSHDLRLAFRSVR